MDASSLSLSIATRRSSMASSSTLSLIACFSNIARDPLAAARSFVKRLIRKAPNIQAQVMIHTGPRIARVALIGSMFDAEGLQRLSFRRHIYFAELRPLITGP
jgi:hypothetical protein